MKGDLERVRCIADYQFGNGAGDVLFPSDTELIYSRNTGRIRYIKYAGELIASFRPTDGMLTLSITGAESIVKDLPSFEYFVRVMDEVSQFPARGGDVFAKHVVDAGEKIRPGDEVVIVDSRRRVLAVGRSMLNKREMLDFSRGVAVKIRHGKE